MEAHRSVVQQEQPFEWIYLVYMAADNNLDWYAVRDVQEMEAFLGSDQVAIIVLLDRASEGEWSDTRVAQILPDVALNDHTSFSLELDTAVSLGELDMGDPDVLADFVSTYAALGTRVALTMWSHGGGWRSLSSRGIEMSVGEHAMRGKSKSEASSLEGGTSARSISWDDTSESKLYVRELREALESTGVKLDILAFDACFMGMIEVVYELKDVSDYIVASQSRIPGRGLDYAAMIRVLCEFPRIDSRNFGVSILQSYHNRYQSIESAALALVETKHLDNLYDRFNEMLSSESWLPAGNEVERMRHWSDVRSAAGPAVSGTPYIDFGAMLLAIAQHEGFGAEFREKAIEALDAFEIARVGHLRVGASQLSGLTIFFPEDLTLEEDEEYSVAEYTSRNIRFAERSRWPEFIQSYTGSAQTSPAENSSTQVSTDEKKFVEVDDYSLLKRLFD